MSAGRKENRFNETWTKEELTDSLRRGDRKTSHRKSEDSRRAQKDADLKSHKSRSRRDEDSSKYSEKNEHKESRHDRSKRQADGYYEEDRHRDKDRHRQRDDRKKSHKDRAKLDSNESDRQRSKQDVGEKYMERSHTSERKSSRHREYKDRDEDRRSHSSKYSSRNEYESSHRQKKGTRQNGDGETFSQEDSRRRSHRSKQESERHDRYKERSINEYDDDIQRAKHNRHRDGRDDKRESNDERRNRTSRHADDDEYRRRRKDGKRRESNEENNGDHHRKREERVKSGEVIRDRDKKRVAEKLRDKGEYDNERRHRKRREESEQNSDRKSHHRKDDSEQREQHKRSERNKYKDSNHDFPDDKESRRNKHNVDDDYVENQNAATENLSKEKSDYNYEDDEFEDYEDDFDDEGRSENEKYDNTRKKPLDEMDELMLALKSENERANSAQSSSRFKTDTSSDGTETPYSQSSYYSHNQSRVNSGNSDLTPVTMISFSIGSKFNSSKTKRRMLKRSTDLLSLIQLESVGFDILDMPPVNEYSLYIKNFGNSNTTQSSVQCNDDNLDQDIQTDIPDTDSKWTQHPPQDLKCSGGEKNISEDNLLENDRQTVLSTLRVNTLRVTKFIKRASKLVEAVLNEDEMWRSAKNDVKLQSELSFCDSMSSLQTNLPYLQGRSIVHIASSQGSSHNIIAVAFEPASHSFSTRIDRKGLIAIWDTRKPAIPEKILVCDASPTHCCFGVGRSYILFAGTDDGCVLAYDLRESGVHHQIVSLGQSRETILRSATYSTGYLEDGHSSPIVSVTAIGAESNMIDDNQLIPQTLDRESRSGLAFQLASLEEAARIFIWIVVEMLPEVDSSDDLGLAPYGRIKLIRSLTYTIPSPAKGIFPVAQFRSTCIQFSLIDPNNFYVGTDTGHIVHCTQYSASSEQTGVLNDSKDVLYNEIESVSPVTTIDVNPFQLFGASLILAGHDDGCLRLYLSDRQYPVISWPFSTDGFSITKVQWSSIRPSVFFVLDHKNCLHVWDLAIMHAGPIKTEVSNTKRMKNFSLSKASVSKPPEIALIFEVASEKKSILEVHKLAPHFSQITDYQELDQLTFLIQSLL